MTRKIISLNDSNWRFGSVPQKPFDDVNDLAEVREWLPAQVPGVVRLDLLRAGKMADPFYAANNEDSQWVDSRDWWYVRELPLEMEQDERAFLVFEGIDYQSAVFANGKQLGRHVGMFSRQVYEIQRTDNRRQTTEGTLRGQKAEGSTPSLATRHSSLAVRIWGSDALPKLRLTLAQKLWKRIVAPLFTPPNEPFPDRYATLKCQMQFGWDFAPRLRTCGIWDEAYIVIARSVFLRDGWIKAQVKSQKAKVANAAVVLQLDSDREQGVRVVLNVRGKNFASDAQAFAFDLQLERGRQTREIAFDLQDARLWNPWDRGEPNLYEIEIQIVLPGPDECLDSLVTTFGIRSFELARTPAAPRGAEPWSFVVNGQREFLRGANWVPLDAIPARLTRDDYAARLQPARDANINFLRVWGGGLKEKRAFYDLCDELGILVWQEFPFAGAILDRFPRDRAFLNFARDECGAIVRALRNHPSLVVWCGGNEFNTRGNRAVVKRLKSVVAREDGTRPFKPASPYRDESHNWRVWHRFANVRDYRYDQTPFLSEFGLQSMPNIESLKKFLPSDALSSPNALWEYHHAELKKLGRYAHSVSLRGAIPLAPPARAGVSARSESKDATKQSPSATKDADAASQTMSRAQPRDALAMTPSLDLLEAFIEATQRAQATGLQIAIEHMRRRKPRTSGIAVWQFNDAWPAISWSVVDYYGQPKRAYAELRRLYAPVLASFDYALRPRRAGDVAHGDLWLINDLLDAFENVELCAYLNEKAIYTRRVNSAPDSAMRLDALHVPLGSGENILRLEARSGERVLSDHEYDLNFCDIGEISPLDALYVAIGNRLMR